eukprot:Clim_evm31s211 gene=Clim_evmTU31s211
MFLRTLSRATIGRTNHSVLRAAHTPVRWSPLTWRSDVREKSRLFATAAAAARELKVTYKPGVVRLELPMNTKATVKAFALSTSSTVGDLRRMLENEGLEDVTVVDPDGSDYAKGTTLSAALKDDIMILIGPEKYAITAPQTTELDTKVEQLKAMLDAVYQEIGGVDHRNTLNELENYLDRIDRQLKPLEQQKKTIEVEAERVTSMWLYTGLAAMAFQWGALYRLTYFEYSWDIVEPLSYFITYGTSVVFYGWFLWHRKEHSYDSYKELKEQRYFFKAARARGFPLDTYNDLLQEKDRVEDEIAMLQRRMGLRSVI